MTKYFWVDARTAAFNSSWGPGPQMRFIRAEYDEVARTWQFEIVKTSETKAATGMVHNDDERGSYNPAYDCD